MRKEKFPSVPESALSQSISPEAYAALGSEMFDINAPSDDSA